MIVRPERGGAVAFIGTLPACISYEPSHPTLLAPAARNTTSHWGPSSW